ncbi:hypothetical protein [Streptomyces sp. LMG1-1-1.1]
MSAARTAFKGPVRYARRGPVAVEVGMVDRVGDLGDHPRPREAGA